MNSQEEVLSFMDLLDLDEEVIDTRLKSIMERNTYRNKHLRNAICLLQYKHLINLQEGSECENDELCTYVAKLLNDVHKENIDDVCKIVNITLCLNKSTVVSKSEHFIQQILSNIELPFEKPSGGPEGHYEDDFSTKTLLNLKICDSILDAIINNNEKLLLPFLETPLERVLVSNNDKLKIHFLNNTVPKIIKGIVGYNILDRIWNYITQLDNSKSKNALKTLSCLSEFYLPVPDNKGNVKFESDIINHYNFWDILFNGLMSDDPASRKISIYLLKRSIDTVICLKKDVHVNSEINKIFTWTEKESKMLKENWNNFFILMDSLEEKQSNIVLPSLQLFETIKCIDSCWINCAFNIGLKHDNTKVRLKCIEHRLKTKIKSLTDAIVLLEALNDINLYDNQTDCEKLKEKISEAFVDKNNFVVIIKAVGKIKWCPIPLYHISEVLAKENLDLSLTIDTIQLYEIVREILKIQCNIIPIRHAFKINITYFIGHCCKAFDWKDLINIYNLVDWEKSTYASLSKNPFIAAIKDLTLNSNVKEEFFKTICSSHANIDFGLTYLENHMADLNIFMDNIALKIEQIRDIGKRQYSYKMECFDDVIFITHLFSKVKAKNNFKDNLAKVISDEYKTITRYIFSLVQSNDDILTIEEINMLFKGFESMTEIDDVEGKSLLLDIYRKMTIVLTNKQSDVETKLFAISIVRIVVRRLYPLSKKKMFSLKQMLHITKHTEVKETSNANDVGRFRNSFYEKSTEIISKYLETGDVRKTKELTAGCSESEYLDEDKPKEIKENLNELIEFVEKVMECGGYGCLRWILKIMNAILPELVDNKNVKFNITKFVERMWKEIEELKSNNQYSLCVQEFVRLIVHDCLVSKAMYNNVIITYCGKIVEYGMLKSSPLLFLAYELNNKEISEEHGQLIYILRDILFFSPVPKKDHRIADNVTLDILQDTKYSLDQSEIDVFFNSDIQFTAIMTLSQIKCPAIFETIAMLIMSKIDDIFSTKNRYHGNSQSHRTLLIGLQHLLLLPLLNQDILFSENIMSWMIQLLGKLPHQPSVRVCLEWFIALNLYAKNIQIDQSVITLLTSRSIPTTSQFMIVYWILKHRITHGTYNLEEFKFVMDFFLCHTMGQIFNLRLHAQYLASELFKKIGMNIERYSYIIEVIQKTFVESAKDKNFMRLQKDFFIKNFDIVEHLTPVFIYYFLPRYCDILINEKVDKKYLKSLFSCVNKTIGIHGVNNAFQEEWSKLRRADEEILFYDINRNTENSKISENPESTGTIQKKYIPWKNMSDIDVFESEKKKETVGELIVVASLIDKLPNLGGMARTSEVFGVKTYVVDSLRHLQDKVFQGLSVSAERWVNIEEVRPGPPLKDYLMKKKAEGYSIVAAEQTSTSVQLQKFKFPKKSLLLLGHEKEGIPCDLLPMMDHCVEIPQQGFVRSLNVHVTAAIFVWEYSRQNIL